MKVDVFAEMAEQGTRYVGRYRDVSAMERRARQAQEENEEHYRAFGRRLQRRLRGIMTRERVVCPMALVQPLVDHSNYTVSPQVRMMWGGREGRFELREIVKTEADLGKLVKRFRATVQASKE